MNNGAFFVLHTSAYLWDTFLEMELLDQTVCAFFYFDKYCQSAGHVIQVILPPAGYKSGVYF